LERQTLGLKIVLGLFIVALVSTIAIEAWNPSQSSTATPPSRPIPASDGAVAGRTKEAALLHLATGIDVATVTKEPPEAFFLRDLQSKWPGVESANRSTKRAYYDQVIALSSALVDAPPDLLGWADMVVKSALKDDLALGIVVPDFINEKLITIEQLREILVDQTEVSIQLCGGMPSYLDNRMRLRNMVLADPEYGKTPGTTQYLAEMDAAIAQYRSGRMSDRAAVEAFTDSGLREITALLPTLPNETYSFVVSRTSFERALHLRNH